MELHAKLYIRSLEVLRFDMFADIELIRFCVVRPRRDNVCGWLLKFVLFTYAERTCYENFVFIPSSLQKKEGPDVRVWLTSQWAINLNTFQFMTAMPQVRLMSLNHNDMIVVVFHVAGLL